MQMEIAILCYISIENRNHAGLLRLNFSNMLDKYCGKIDTCL